MTALAVMLSKRTTIGRSVLDRQGCEDFVCVKQPLRRFGVLREKAILGESVVPLSCLVCVRKFRFPHRQTCLRFCQVFCLFEGCSSIGTAFEHTPMPLYWHHCLFFGALSPTMIPWILSKKGRTVDQRRLMCVVIMYIRKMCLNTSSA